MREIFINNRFSPCFIAGNRKKNCEGYYCRKEIADGEPVLWTRKYSAKHDKHFPVAYHIECVPPGELKEFLFNDHGYKTYLDAGKNLRKTLESLPHHNVMADTKQFPHATCVLCSGSFENGKQIVYWVCGASAHTDCLSPKPPEAKKIGFAKTSSKPIQKIDKIESNDIGSKVLDCKESLWDSFEGFNEEIENGGWGDCPIPEEYRDQIVKGFGR